MTQNSTPRYILKKNENICPNNNLYTYVHGSITHNSQRWKQHKCPSSNEWINKIWSIHTMDCYSAKDTCCNVDEP